MATPQAPQVTYDQTVELTFQGVLYSVHAYVRTDTLHVEVEHLHSADRWLGEFSAAALEEMTYKTGNIKKFPTFVKMLSTALSQASDTVFIDILTYADLELLKQRKAAAAAGGSQAFPPPPSLATNPAHPNNSKRYVILTYIVEFDKVHYPLPLKFESAPDPARLKALVSHLRADVAAAQDQAAAANAAAAAATASVRAGSPSRAASSGSGSGASGGVDASARLSADCKRLQEENRKLRQTVRAVSLTTAAAADAPSSAATAASASAGTSAAATIARLEAEVRDLKLRLAAAADAVASLRALSATDAPGAAEAADGAASAAETAALRAELSAATATLRREAAQLQRDHAALADELDRRTAGERAAKDRVRALTEELARLRLRGGGAVLGGGGSGGASGSSSGGLTVGRRSAEPSPSRPSSGVYGGTSGVGGRDGSVGARAGSTFDRLYSAHTSSTASLRAGRPPTAQRLPAVGTDSGRNTPVSSPYLSSTAPGGGRSRSRTRSGAGGSGGVSAGSSGAGGYRPGSRSPSPALGGRSLSRTASPAPGGGVRGRESLSFRRPPSPSSRGGGHGGAPRFDPVAYVQQRQQQRQQRQHDPYQQQQQRQQGSRPSSRAGSRRGSESGSHHIAYVQIRGAPHNRKRRVVIPIIISQSNSFSLLVPPFPPSALLFPQPLWWGHAQPGLLPVAARTLAGAGPHPLPRAGTPRVRRHARYRAQPPP
jgi:coiled-coil domain-containing protein 61